MAIETTPSGRGRAPSMSLARPTNALKESMNRVARVGIFLGLALAACSSRPNGGSRSDSGTGGAVGTGGSGTGASMGGGGTAGAPDAGTAGMSGTGGATSTGGTSGAGGASSSGGQSGMDAGSGTACAAVLDVDQILAAQGLQEPQWYKDNIPFVDTPDTNINGVYYYRWSTHKRALRYTTAGAGYIATEYDNPVWYSVAGLVQRPARCGRLPHPRRPLASQPNLHGRLHQLLGAWRGRGAEPPRTASGSPARPISATWSPATPLRSRRI